MRFVTAAVAFTIALSGCAIANGIRSNMARYSTPIPNIPRAALPWGANASADEPEQLAINGLRVGMNVDSLLTRVLRTDSLESCMAEPGARSAQCVLHESEFIPMQFPGVDVRVTTLTFSVDRENNRVRSINFLSDSNVNTDSIAQRLNAALSKRWSPLQSRRIEADYTEWVGPIARASVSTATRRLWVQLWHRQSSTADKMTVEAGVPKRGYSRTTEWWPLWQPFEIAGIHSGDRVGLILAALQAETSVSHNCETVATSIGRRCEWRKVHLNLAGYGVNSLTAHVDTSDLRVNSLTIKFHPMAVVDARVMMTKLGRLFEESWGKHRPGSDDAWTWSRFPFDAELKLLCSLSCEVGEPKVVWMVLGNLPTASTRDEGQRP